MAFDLAQFDLSGFDVGGSGAIFFGGLAQEKTTALIGTSREIYFVGSAFERVNFDMVKAGNGIFLLGTGIAEVSDAHAIGENTTILSGMIASEAVNGEAECRSVNYLHPVGLDSLSIAEALPGSSICFAGKAVETVSGTAYNEKEISFVAAAYELINGKASLEAVDIETCELIIRLEPGQKLIIDSINYYVWLDGENAIECHRGVWLDNLSRDTSSLSITAASGTENLSASILYTEQYL